MSIFLKLCRHAKCKRLPLCREEALMCSIEKGRSNKSIPGVRDEEVCVGTVFYSTGHTRYDTSVSLDKIKECPYRPRKGR